MLHEFANIAMVALQVWTLGQNVFQQHGAGIVPVVTVVATS